MRSKQRPSALLFVCFVAWTATVEVSAQNTTCAVCPPGSFSDPSVCGDCPRGSCSVDCPVCPPGTAGLGGVYSCVTCCPGTFSPGNQTVCSPCREVSGSGYGASFCCPCADGLFGSVVDPQSCSREYGLFRRDEAHRMSIAHILRRDLSESQPDDEDSVSNDVYACAIGVPSSLEKLNQDCTGFEDSCVPCPRGTYRSRSDKFCQTCGVGKYSEVVGSSSPSNCLDCPEGKYCPFSATSAPIECPENYRCTSKSESPEVCSALDDSQPGEKDCENTPAFVLLILGIIFSIAVYIGLIFLFWRQYRKKLSEERLSAHSGPQIYSGL